MKKNKIIFILLVWLILLHFSYAIIASSEFVVKGCIDSPREIQKVTGNFNVSRMDHN